MDFKVKLMGIEEAIDKANELERKVKEAQALMKELASMEVKFSFNTDPDLPEDD